VIVFGILAVALVASAVFTIAARNPVHSVVGLLANFVVLAMLYLMLSAEFLAIVQIVVYSGAILILFLFVIALLSSGIGPFRTGPDRLPKLAVPGGALALLMLGSLVVGIERTPLTLVVQPVGGVAPSAGTAGSFGSVGDFGLALFTTHLLPFETTAFVLMVAVIGVVLLAGDVVPQRTRGTHVRPSHPKRESIVKGKIERGTSG